MSRLSIRIRNEVRSIERRAPLVPVDAARLIQHGIAVTVEESPQRIFPIADYVAAGCTIAAPDSWVTAPADEYILGLKELPAHPEALRHRHIYFGHAYKGQESAPRLLRRFAAGGGTLLDLEYLADDEGHRLVTFGFWAGFAGTALAVLHYRRLLRAPLRATSMRVLADRLGQPVPGRPPRVLVIGALGRCGHGARSALQAAGITPTCWDIAETASLDTDALLDHDIVVNTVLASQPARPFLTPTELRKPRRLSLIADISCDVGSSCNMMPVYDRLTSWSEPVFQCKDDDRLHIIAIDNLPSLLPTEASTAFSTALAPYLMVLGEPSQEWQRCVQAFHHAVANQNKEREPTVG